MEGCPCASGAAQLCDWSSPPGAARHLWHSGFFRKTQYHHFAINRITSVCGRTGRPLACEDSKYIVRQFSEMVQQTSTLNGEGTMYYMVVTFLTFWPLRLGSSDNVTDGGKCDSALRFKGCKTIDPEAARTATDSRRYFVEREHYSQEPGYFQHPAARPTVHSGASIVKSPR
jgi:hypothetical protein